MPRTVQERVEHALAAVLEAVDQGADAETRARAAQAVVSAISQGGELRKAVVKARREAVNEMRAAGRSLGDIAGVLGVSRGTAQLISEGKQTGRVGLPPKPGRR